jgi:D-amino-acid dehydrogenase
MGASYEMLSFDEILEFEPHLKHMRSTIVGGIREKIDDTADAYKFCTGLEKKLRDMGVQFHFNTTVTEIQKDKKKITKVITDKGEFGSDMFVMSLGSYSTDILKKIGIRIPLYPLKGYSITIDIKNETSAPISSITFDNERTVFSRIGNRIRVSGTAEFAGYDTSITPERIEMLKKLTRQVFPDCGDIETATEWACLRPTTPDCRPIIGHSKYDNLVLNTGQGSLGWTMAFASAKLTADIIDGNKTGIDAAPYSINRF